LLHTDGVIRGNQWDQFDLRSLLKSADRSSIIASGAGNQDVTQCIFDGFALKTKRTAVDLIVSALSFKEIASQIVAKR